MYSMVMMMTMASGGDVVAFGGRNGCNGGGCSGWTASSSCGCSGGGFIGHRRSSGCSGYAANTCCAPVQSCGCNGGGSSCRGGLFGGCGAKHSCHGGSMNCCNTGNSCCGGQVSANCCGGGGTVVMPAAEPAKEMPKAGETPKKKDN